MTINSYETWYYFPLPKAFMETSLKFKRLKQKILTLSFNVFTKAKITFIFLMKQRLIKGAWSMLRALELPGNCQFMFKQGLK